jgi:hypothetical protein
MAAPAAGLTVFCGYVLLFLVFMIILLVSPAPFLISIID